MAAIGALIALAGCGESEPEGRGGISKAEADELNEAAATLDAQQRMADEAFTRR